LNVFRSNSSSKTMTNEEVCTKCGDTVSGPRQEVADTIKYSSSLCGQGIGYIQL